MNNNDTQPLISQIQHLNSPEDKRKRVIAVGEYCASHKFNNFCNNKVRTTKYNIISWLPKSILMQFQRIANIYFLIIMILNFFYFSPKNPISMVITFGIILFFTSIKEAIEDHKRYKKDKKSNDKKYSYFNDITSDNKAFERKKSKNIHVGEILRIYKDEELPADLCLLKSSNKNGVCFIDTVNLDGESNLKDKKSVLVTQSLSDYEVCTLNAVIKCDKPNDQLDYWEGYMTVFRSGGEIKTSVNIDQFLLKGSYLKNTEYIIGVVIYTGHETKILQNAKQPKCKLSKVMRTINKILYSFLFIQITSCCLLGYLSLIWQEGHIDQYSFIRIVEPNEVLAYLARVGTFIISYSQLIPISMYMGVEFIRLFQMPLIKYDDNIYDYTTKKPSIAKTSELPDELGQVEYILSDKTGTITQNCMELKKISVEDKIFSQNDIVSYFTRKGTQPGRAKNEHSNISSNFSLYAKDSTLSSSDLVSSNEEYFISRFDEDNIKQCVSSITDLYRAVSICNSIVIDSSKSREKNSEIVYQSTSIDELALETGSSAMGIKLIDKTTNLIQINFFNQFVEDWEVLATLPFDSERKRMTLIAKFKGEIFLYCKGADEVLFNKISDDLSKQRDITDKFATEGLRTLIITKKRISPEEFDYWYHNYETILNNMNLTHSNKNNALTQIFEEIETNLEYIGCSAIEDKLQEDAPDTIKVLKEAGIRIWMLTGDKIENSLEIAKLTNLIDDKEIRVNFNIRNIHDFNEFSDEIRLGRPFGNYYLILDGKTLTYFDRLEDKKLREKFVEIMTHCSSAICCRLTPKQKAKITKLLKNKQKRVILSVGDGANDVPMILESSVGVGIAGKEGSQAVRSSDFAIPQFRFLKDLILVHGRLAYKRLSSYTCYAFYKNVITVFTEVYFIGFNGFSGQIYFSDWFTNLYNTFWSSWPMLINFTLDKDVDRKTALNYPVLYHGAYSNAYLNLKVFWKWISLAIFHGAIIFWVPVLVKFLLIKDEPDKN